MSQGLYLVFLQFLASWFSKCQREKARRIKQWKQLLYVLFFSNILKDTTFLHQGVTNSTNVTICNTLGPFAQNMARANHWLRGTKTHTFPW